MLKELNPVKIVVEDEFVRAVTGGVGQVKTPGNYAASLKAQEVAEQKDIRKCYGLMARKKNILKK